MDSLRKTLLPPAVDSVESNAYRLCHELMRMGRFEDAAFAARSLTPTELSSLDCDGNNLLHHAAASGSLELVEVVMDGLNSPDEIATRSKQGSALWIAMEGGHEEAACAIAQRVCAEHLLDIEKYGSTALDYARGRQLTGLQSIIIRKLSTLADTLPANTLLRYQLLAQATGCNQRDVAREIIASLDSKVDTVAWEPDTLCQ
ncbi:MAG: hypothetical protein KDK78_04950 [Chlamydiia bacterium]|nr:hypothetical protein [Chlamydiia bacterium]